MPSHFFQPMPHSIHLVLGFDLALYSWSRDLHPLDCVHAAHTKEEPRRSGLFRIGKLRTFSLSVQKIFPSPLP